MSIRFLYRGVTYFTARKHIVDYVVPLCNHSMIRIFFSFQMIFVFNCIKVLAVKMVPCVCSTRTGNKCIVSARANLHNNITMHSIFLKDLHEIVKYLHKKARDSCKSRLLFKQYLNSIFISIGNSQVGTKNAHIENCFINLHCLCIVHSAKFLTRGVTWYFTVFGAMQ